MIKNNSKVITFIIGIFLIKSSSFAGNNLKILANVNEKAITEADLKTFMKITKNSDRKKALKEYTELIQHSYIASVNGIKFNRKDRTEYWSRFKAKNNISQNKTKFCKENGISEDFLNNYIKMTAIWEIYYDNFIVRSVKVTKDAVIENMDINGKIKTEDSYELSGIILNYSSSKQKKDIKNKLENIFIKVKTNKISFSEAVKSVNKSDTLKSNIKKDDNYLGWVNRSDFNDLFANTIENTSIGSITNPICTESNNKGSCVIFVVHDLKSVININEREEIYTFNELYKKTIETKTMEVVSSFDDIIKVGYNL